MSSIALPTATPHTSSVCAPSQAEIEDQIVASYGTIKMVIPKRSFGYRAVVIKQDPSADQTIKGLIQEARNIYTATRELLFVWQKHKITDYLHYREDSLDYAMQITPFPRKTWGLLQRLNFLVNTAIGMKHNQNPLIAEKFRESYNKLKDAGEFENIESFLKEAPKLDLPELELEEIEEKKVFEGVFTKVLVYYKPTVPIHLLIIPNRFDAKRFSDLTLSEFTEIHLLSEKIRQIYKQISPHTIISIFSRTGEQAGQTVALNHFHISVREPLSTFHTALYYLRKIVFPYPPFTTESSNALVNLRKEDLAELPAFIESYRAELTKEKTD